MHLRIYYDVKHIPEEVLNEIKKFDSENIYGYLSDPFTFNIGIVFDGDKVLGMGIIRIINEFKMVINNTSNHNKASVLKLFMDEALKLKQCNEVIVTLTLPKDKERMNKYKDILNKHYNFQEDVEDIMRLEN